jgi:hypothetical protein
MKSITAAALDLESALLSLPGVLSANPIEKTCEALKALLFLAITSSSCFPEVLITAEFEAK